MRLSEAIRLGAMLHPQCFGILWTHENAQDPSSRVTRTCALGAAEQAGFDVMNMDVQDSYRCPVDDCIRGGLVSVISTLNDHHRWTREAIADFVQTLEQPEPAPAVDPADHLAQEGSTREKAYV